MPREDDSHPRMSESVRAWKPAVAGIREVLHARFMSHAYPLHTHDVWTLFIVDEGAIAYDLDRREGRIREFLDAHLLEPITMAAAGVESEAGPTQLARAFSAAYRIAPHAYVLGRRIEAARDRILAGQPLADVAAEVGFYDQAHL